MTFDYRRFFVISVLILHGLIGVNCQGENKESNQRIQQLEELVLTYLRLSKLENEQQLKLLGQDRQNDVQQYYTSEYDNSGWLQNSYDFPSYPEPFALWRGAAAANPRNVANPHLIDSWTNGRLSKIPATSITNGGANENTMSPSSYNLNNYYGFPSFPQTSYLPQFYGRNPYMPPYIPAYNDRLRNLVPPFFVDDYNLNLGQPLNNRKLVGNPQDRLQDNEGYQFASMISEPFGGFGMRPPQMRKRLSTIGDENNNLIFTNTDEFNRLPGRANIKSPTTLNNGQGSVDIDTSPGLVSENANNKYTNGVQPTTGTILKGGGGKAPKMKVHGKSSNGNIVKDTKNMGNGGMKPAAKKYKLLIVDGESGISNGVNFDKMHQELFASQGLDSTGTVQTNAQITEKSSTSGNQPYRTFQSVSTSNNGAGESTNVVSFQGGLAEDGTTTTVFEENQPRDLSAQYSGTTGYGSFSQMNILPTGGLQNIRKN